MTNWILVAVYLLCSVGGLTLVKIGGGENLFSLSKTLFSLNLSYMTLIGLFLYIISFLLWIVIVNRYALSYIQPLTAGLSYVLILAASVLILKEAVTPLQWGGLAFILVGVILMNLGR